MREPRPRVLLEMFAVTLYSSGQETLVVSIIISTKDFFANALH